MRSKPRKKHVQLSLERARKPTGIGGWRPGAGRKKKPGSISHDRRAKVDPRHPQHVTLRLVPGLSIARDWLMRTIHSAIKDGQKPEFRIVEFNVLSNHLHLVVEVAGKRALSTGIQGFQVRTARRLNKVLKRTGKVFANRYHVRALKTPREVRNVLCYVLLNRKHHNAKQKFAKYWIDPYSSAAWFAGWASPIYANTDWKRELLTMEAPNAKPTVWLLTTGWKRHGLLRFDEAPA